LNSGLLKIEGDVYRPLRELLRSLLAVVPHPLSGLRSNIAGRMITDLRRVMMGQ